MIELILIFKYLGVSIIDTDYIFGDKKGIVDISTLLNSNTQKRYNALLFRRVRNVMVSKAVQFYHIPGVINPADILSKHLVYTQILDVLKPLLFWEGDTYNLIK